MAVIWILGFLAVCVVVYLNVVATWMLCRSKVVSGFQRGTQFVLIWIVPVVGATIVISILTDPADRRRRQARWARWAPDGDGGETGNAGDFNTQHGHHHGGHSGDAGHGGHGGDGGHGGGDGGDGGH
jgi:hypothetical protein